MAKLNSLFAKQRNGHVLTDNELDEMKKLRRNVSVPDEIAYGKATNRISIDELFSEHTSFSTISH